MASSLLTACGSKEKVIEPEKEVAATTPTPTPTEAPTPEPTEEPTPEPTKEPTPEPTKETAQAPFADEVTYTSIELTFINLCSEDIGLIAVQDPITEEQINVDGIKAGKKLDASIYWPSDKTEFKWAIYAQDGNRLAVTTVDMTGVTTAVTITISGTDSIEDIDCVVE